MLSTTTWLNGIAVTSFVLWVAYGVCSFLFSTERRFLSDRIMLVFRESDPGELIGPAWMRGALNDVTSLGSTVALMIVTLVTVCALLMARRSGAALAFAGSFIVARATTTLLKTITQRARPDVAPHLTEVVTSSFPSAHALMSTVVYLTLAGIVSLRLQRPGARYLAFAGAIGMSVMIGVSRVALGVHRPGDVLAGWTLGTLFAALTIGFLRWPAGRRLSQSGA